MIICKISKVSANEYCITNVYIPPPAPPKPQLAHGCANRAPAASQIM